MNNIIKNMSKLDIYTYKKIYSYLWEEVLNELTYKFMKYNLLNRYSNYIQSQTYSEKFFNNSKYEYYQYLRSIKNNYVITHHKYENTIHKDLPSYLSDELFYLNNLKWSNFRPCEFRDDHEGFTQEYPQPVFKLLWKIMMYDRPIDYDLKTLFNISP